MCFQKTWLNWYVKKYWNVGTPIATLEMWDLNWSTYKIARKYIVNNVIKRYVTLHNINEMSTLKKNHEMIRNLESQQITLKNKIYKEMINLIYED